ncbi:MAG: TonB-dependent receptor [Niabella sp.]
MMQLKKLYCIVAMMLFGICSSAQSGHIPVIGFVHDEGRNPVASATIRCVEQNLSASTDANGRFELLFSGEGSFSLEISAVGYATLKTQINVTKEKEEFFFTLQKENALLDSVAVFGYSATQLTNRQAYNVTAIDAQKLHNTTLDIAHVLDRVPGARLRETGGVGSDYDFSISGFSGKRVKFFLDGIPMDNFGSSFQINNIPVNLAERIEVYKGVIPVWLGSDALGGAVNIITNNKMRNYLDVSYSYGSFNTHRSYINAGYTSKKGFTVRLNAFQNYSDNDYKVFLNAADIRTGRYVKDTTLKRFHDNYKNETVITQIGFADKKWTDLFLVGITLGKNYKEIQTGAQQDVVFGAWHTRGSLVMPTLKYQKKDLFTENLNASLSANYNFGKERNIDTVHARYGWLADSITYSGRGGETPTPMNYKYGNNAANVITTFTYDVANRHHFAVNNVYSHFNRNGHDYFATNSLIEQIPQKTNKNITGISYQYEIPQLFSITLFGKYLTQNANTTLIETSVFNPDDTVYNHVKISRHKTGYGTAASYYINPALQLKFSYEKAHRMPESEDIFGDMINRGANWNVAPETSDNFNLGINYWATIQNYHKLYFNVNGLYYHVKNYIAYLFNAAQTKTIAYNYMTASNTGVEGEMRYAYKNKFTAGVNLTYQNITDRQQEVTEPQTGATFPNNNYKERIANVPYLFGNADASLFLNNVFTKEDKMSINYNFLYVHSYYLYPGKQAFKLDIPEQLSHDINITYTLKNSRYNIGAEAKNITDAKLYDNFRLQKPGRAFYLKLRYFINK